MPGQRKPDEPSSPGEQVAGGDGEERFRRFFELGLIGMAITSPAKGVLEVNDEICNILGYGRDELLRMTWAEITHPDDLAADVAAFDRVMAGEVDGYAMDKRWVRKDGQVIDTTISVKCLRRADGSIDYFMALLQDITERKQAEEALRRARHGLERRVIKRTSQLSAINDALIKEIAERRRVAAHLPAPAHRVPRPHARGNGYRRHRRHRRAVEYYGLESGGRRKVWVEGRRGARPQGE